MTEPQGMMGIEVLVGARKVRRQPWNRNLSLFKKKQVRLVLLCDNNIQAKLSSYFISFCTCFYPNLLNHLPPNTVS